MASHKYAIKVKGKALGIKDDGQLARIMNSGEVTEETKICILEEKKWLPVGKLSNFEQLQALAEEEKAKAKIAEEKKALENEKEAEAKAAAEEKAEAERQIEKEEQTQSDSGEKEKTKTDEFAALMGELRTQEVQAVKESELDGYASGPHQSIGDLADEGKTIRKVGKKKNQRITETLVAAKVPNPEGVDRRVAFLTLTLTLILGLAVGFYVSTFFMNEGGIPKASEILSAENQERDTPSEKKNN